MAVPSSSSSQRDEKLFLSAERVQAMAEALAFQIATAGVRPTFLMAIWRGGCPAGMIVQEFLEVAHGAPIDHIAARTISRDPATGTALPVILVHATGHAVASLRADDRLVIIDDVWDSGRSTEAILAHLRRELGERMPDVCLVGTLFYKPKRNKTRRVPDFYVEATDEWLVFPHELVGLSSAEIATHRPNVAAMLRTLASSSGE
jgi:hypoxanthine phosphoribosyltransferase